MTDESESIGKELVERIKQNAGNVIAIGAILVIVGVLALAAPLVAGLSIAMAVGVLLILGGIAQLVFAFHAGSLGKGLLAFALGALSVAIGGVIFAQPGVGLATLTLVLAAYFVVEGIFEMIWAFQIKPVDGWGWSLFSGIVSLLLGIMIWSEFPLSGAWAVGVLVGIKMIFSGWTLIALASAARSAAREAQARP